MSTYPHLSWRKPVSADAMHTALPGLYNDDPEDWRARAACTQVDPELFFPDVGGSPRQALRVCAGCPVRQTCLQEALANERGHEPFGVWGGCTPDQRRVLLGRRPRHSGAAA